MDVVFPEYTTRAIAHIITSEFDRDNQHVLVKHNDTNQQIAVFIGSIPDPLPDPNAPPPAGATSASEQFYQISAGGVNLFAYSIENGQLRFTYGNGSHSHYVDLGGSYYVYVPDSATYLYLQRGGDVGLTLSGVKFRSSGTWNIGDEIEVVNQADNNAVIFTLTLTDDYSLGWAGAGLPPPPVYNSQPIAANNYQGNKTRLYPTNISATEITFLNVNPIPLEQSTFLYIPAEDDIIYIPPAYWVRNTTKNVWLNTGAYNYPNGQMSNSRGSKWDVGDNLQIGQNSGLTTSFFITITNTPAP